MLRYIVILFGIVSILSGIEIEMKEGKEDGKNFSTLNLQSEQLVHCSKRFDDFETIAEIKCRFKAGYGRKLRNFSNSFFDVEIKRKYKETTIHIYPRFNARIFSSDRKIPNLKFFVPHKKLEKAKHWLVLGYKSETPPFIKGDNLYNPRKINFPVQLSYKNIPFIGALDIDGVPIKEEESADVKLYLELKEAFHEGRYRAVIRQSNEIVEKYPHTLFRPELTLYHIRALFKLKAYQQIINISKDFLRNYSNDNAVPEVLLYTAYVHSKLGFLAYAKYYFTRLFEEHKDSEYRNMGFVYYGDDRIYGGRKNDGIQLYKKALYNTKDKLIATKAAYRLGNIYLKELKPDKAEQYLSKVANGNPKYFKKNFSANYELAQDLADAGKKYLASQIVESILKGEEPYDVDNYEKMLKDLAVWLDESNQVEKAFKEYSRYLSIYDYGVFDKLVRTNKDRLLFLRNETNNSKRFANYNKLIETYHLDSDIGKQAIYEKAKLLHDTDEFEMVLDIEKDLEVARVDFPDTKRLIQSSATHEAIRYLNKEIDDNYKPLNVETSSVDNKVRTEFAKQDNANLQNRTNCETAIKFIEKYSLTLPNKEDEKLFNCSMKTGKYKLSTDIAKRNIDSGQNTLDWVYRYSQIMLNTGKYKKFISLSDEVISLMNIDGSDKYLDIYYDRFKAFNILRKDEKVIETVNKLDKYFRDSYKNLQPFKSIVSIAKDRKDDLLIEQFAKRVIKIQQRFKSYLESPEIELLLITSLKHQNKIKEAISVGEEVLNRKMSKEKKARIYYELGVAYQNLNNLKKSKTNFEKSVAISPNNVWSKLSQDYLDMF